MNQKKFDVVVFRKDMDDDHLAGFAQMMEKNYTNGFRYLESFDAGGFGFVISVKDVDVCASSPIEHTKDEIIDPTTESDKYVSPTILADLKTIAKETLGWDDLEDGMVNYGDYDAFWEVVERTYKCTPSGKSIVIKNNQLQFLESIARQIVKLKTGTMDHSQEQTNDPRHGLYC
jgi:hypothetical protein